MRLSLTELEPDMNDETRGWRRLRSPSRGMLIGAAAVAGVAIFVIAKLGHSSDDGMAKDQNAPPLVTVVVPALGNVTATVSLTGQIGAHNDMPIGVEGDGGRISAVLVEPGDHVHQGQVLARLNPLTAQSQVDSAEATVDELRANAATAEAEYARAEKARDSFSAEEFDRRRTASLTAKAKAKAAEAQLSEAHTRWQRTSVVAPSDGIVLTRAAEVGQIAMPGAAPLFRLARGGEIEMRGQVAEQDMPRLKVGQTALVRLEGVAQPFTGKVWQIGAIIDTVTRQGTVRISLPAADQNLRPGAFARADIQAGATVGVILPQTAVLSDEQGTYTLIVGADDKIVRRAVTVAGAHSEGLLISNGLTGNERVVAIAGAFLRTGEAVQVAPGNLAGGGGGGGGGADTNGKRNVAAGTANAVVSAP
jgi:HlyD family secretion protein